MDVVPDSPAAKSDLRNKDVLADGQRLEELATPRDLMNAVRKVQGKELKLKFIRSGERKEIIVTPEKRNGDIRVWRDPLNVRIFRPGHMLPPRVGISLKRR